MIEFSTREVDLLSDNVEIACLTTDPEDIPEGSGNFVLDGEELPLPEELTTGLINAIKACHNLENRGFGVDCTVFGVLALGGSYTPVSDTVYRRGLHRRFTLGRWLSKEDALGVAPTAELVQFVKFAGRSLPLHTAVKLPGLTDLYIQKVGHDLPVVITGAIQNLRFHQANTVATVNEISATYHSLPVLSYRSSNPENDPVDIYVGLPG